MKLVAEGKFLNYETKMTKDNKEYYIVNFRQYLNNEDSKILLFDDKLLNVLMSLREGVDIEILIDYFYSRRFGKEIIKVRDIVAV